jgi:hypothetical protein
MLNGNNNNNNNRNNNGKQIHTVGFYFQNFFIFNLCVIDPRYYNTYPSNVQWQQQPQQWPTNQPQQQMGAVSHSQQTQMRGPPQQQQQHQAAMYANNAHYGYGGTTAGWNTGAHPSQSYGYPQNPSYDPSLVSTPQQQQQYYSQSQMHNPPQGYEYAPPPQQQPPPPPQMN